ncbi:MAG: OmpH family outer membrane protein [Alphaproteobacteria bacterium]
MRGDRRYRGILLALAISVLVLPPAVAAQDRRAGSGVVIATIDFDKVMRESSAGRKFREQLDQRYAQSEEEIKRMQADVERLRQDLATNGDSLSPEERQKRRNEFQRRKAEGFQLLQERKEQINRMFERGKQQIEVALREIVKQIAEERGIDLVLNRSGPDSGSRPSGAVLYTARDVDIDDLARQRLDARLPSLGPVQPVE